MLQGQKSSSYDTLGGSSQDQRSSYDTLGGSSQDQRSSYDTLGGSSQGQRCSKCKELLLNQVSSGSRSSGSRRLSCKHTFCNTCVVNICSSSFIREIPRRGRIRCPVCSQVTSFTDGEISPCVSVTSLVTHPVNVATTATSFSRVAPLVTRPVCVATTSTPATSVGAAKMAQSFATCGGPVMAGGDPIPSSESVSPSYSSISCDQPHARNVSIDKVQDQSDVTPPKETATDEAASGNDKTPREATKDPAIINFTPPLSCHLKRPHPDSSDASSDEEFHDTSQVIDKDDEQPVSTRVDVNLCAVCSHSKRDRPKRRKNEAAFYCFDCTSPMCEGCMEKHGLRPRCKDHVCCPVTKDNIAALVCEKHQEYAEDYCVDCRCVTCSECHVSNHRGHSIRAFTTQPVESTMIRELAQRKATNIRAMEHVDSTEANYLEELRNTKDDMKKVRNDIIGAINANFEAMFSTLDVAHTQWKDRIDALRRFVFLREFDHVDGDRRKCWSWTNIHIYANVLPCVCGERYSV